MSNFMAKKCKVVSILIIILFLNLLILPLVSAEEQTDSDRLLTIWMPGITENNYFRQIQVSEEELQLLIDNIDNTLNIINKLATLYKFKIL